MAPKDQINKMQSHIPAQCSIPSLQAEWFAGMAIPLPDACHHREIEARLKSSPQGIKFHRLPSSAKIERKEEHMEFDWTPQTIGEWRELLAQAPQANWMQSWPYARAAFLRDHKAAKLALIKKDHLPIGLMVVQEIRLGPIHFVDLQRGPLWFGPHRSESLLREFAELFRKTYPRRLFRRVRCMPEWEESESAKTILKENGFQQLPQTYQTIWIDLDLPLEILRSRLKQKWRNSLNQGEKHGLEIKMDPKGTSINYFLQKYEEHQKVRKYKGPGKEFIKEEFLSALKIGDVMTLWAKQNEDFIAGIMIAFHGQTASYRIGWSTEAGRAARAHHVLLWRAIEMLKEKNLKAFDLGGIKSAEAIGVTQFKRGMGGREQKFIGVWK